MKVEKVPNANKAVRSIASTPNYETTAARLPHPGGAANEILGEERFRCRRLVDICKVGNIKCLFHLPAKDENQSVFMALVSEGRLNEMSVKMLVGQIVVDQGTIAWRPVSAGSVD